MTLGDIAPYLMGMAIYKMQNYQFQSIFLVGAIAPLFVLFATYKK
jgi:hypothetical protein